MRIKTNRVDPDQTAPVEQSDQGLHCLPNYYCPNINRHCSSGFIN